MSKKKTIEEPVVELPVLTSLTLHKLPNQGSDAWVVLEIKTQGDKVISTKQLDTPNMKSIAKASLKNAVVKQFFN